MAYELDDPCERETDMRHYARRVWCLLIQVSFTFKMNDILQEVPFVSLVFSTHNSHDNQVLMVSEQSDNHQNLAQTLAALMSSSARHSAMDLMFLKAASRAPVQRSHMA